MTEELKKLKTKLEIATTEEIIEQLEYCGRDPYYSDIYEIVVQEIIIQKMIVIQKIVLQLNFWNGVFKVVILLLLSRLQNGKNLRSKYGNKL